MGVVFGYVLPSGGDLDLFSPPKNNSSWEGGTLGSLPLLVRPHVLAGDLK